METIQIKGAKRENFGKKGSKDVRREGRVPAVIYGGHEEPIHFSLEEKEMKPLLFTPNSYIVELDIDGRKEQAVMRDVQFHPVKDYPMHVDFFRVLPGKPVAIDVPVKIVGNSEGVKLGGKLTVQKRKLRISGLVENLPDFLEVDITNLGIGKSIFVGDLKYDNLTLLTPGDHFGMRCHHDACRTRCRRRCRRRQVGIEQAVHEVSDSRTREHRLRICRNPAQYRF